MDDLELRDRLSAISFRLECCASLIYILYDGMNRDAYSTKSIAPAVFAAYEYLDRTTEELRQLPEGDEAPKRA